MSDSKNPYRRRAWCVWVGVMACSVVSGWSLVAVAQDMPGQLAAIREIGGGGAGYDAAMRATQTLSALPSSHAATVLTAMKNATPLAKNWLRMVASDVADNGEFPRQVLLQFFEDRSQDVDARHAAYQMLVSHEPDLKATLLAAALDDPSLPVRHLAVADVLTKADQAKAAGQNQAAVSQYRQVLSYGRNPDQLQAAAKALNDLGDKVELADELGLVRRWWVIGTFDNTSSAHFETVYEPEKVYRETGRLPADWLKDNAQATDKTGKSEPAVTKLVSSDDSFGVVNINPAMNNAKDAIAYCYAELSLQEAVDAVAKLGCITASKVWVNGELVMANEVYHSGSRIDQYTGACKLVPGSNTVLIKICQNAQTEPWAQDWQFQFRCTDQVETPVKPLAILQPAAP